MIDVANLLTTGIAALVGPSAIFFALLAIGLNIHFGYTGLLNFGQIGFALVGGYGMGIAVVNFAASAFSSSTREYTLTSWGLGPPVV